MYCICTYARTHRHMSQQKEEAKDTLQELSSLDWTQILRFGCRCPPTSTFMLLLFIAILPMRGKVVLVFLSLVYYMMLSRSIHFPANDFFCVVEQHSTVYTYPTCSPSSTSVQCKWHSISMAVWVAHICGVLSALHMAGGGGEWTRILIQGYLA